jgi:hypothetical protein
MTTDFNAGKSAAMDACVAANRVLLEDKSWQMFGYAKRPKHGSLLGRWFRARWRVQLEEQLSREIFCTCVGIDAVSKQLSIGSLKQAIREYTAFDGIIGAFGYATLDAAQNDLVQAIAQYADTPAASWGNLFLSRIKFNEVPDRGMAARLLAGSAKLSVAAQGLMARMEQLR